MLKNNIHNLLHQLSEISDSAWRIEKHYLEESNKCDTCVDLWRQLHEDYDRHIELIKAELNKHINE